MLYIINSIRLIKPVNNEVGHDDNKAVRGITDYVFALKTRGFRATPLLYNMV